MSCRSVGLSSTRTTPDGMLLRHCFMMRKKLWPQLSFGAWLIQADARMNRFKLAIALANKLARIAWSVLWKDQAFDANREVIPAI